MTAQKHFKHLVRARMIATGESYSQARAGLLDTQTDVAFGEPLVIDAHGRHGQAVLFTADGQAVVSGGQDAAIRITDAGTGAGKAVLTGHDKVVTDLALTPDGRLVSVSSDRTARVWDLATGRTDLMLDGHRDAVVAVSVAPGGATATTGGYDGRIRHFDLDSGTCLAEIRSDLRRIAALAHTPDGSHTIEAGQGGDVLVRTAADGALVARLATGAPGVVGLAVAPDGSVAATAGYDGAVCLWDTGTWAEVRRIAAGDRANAVTISRSGRLLGAAVRRRVLLWSFTDDEPLATTDLPIDGVYALAFSPDGRRLAQTGADGKVRIWTLRP